MSDSTNIRVAYLTVGYPTLSQTFIQREVEGLARNGIDITVFPCRQFGTPHKINNITVVPISPLFIFAVIGSLLRILFTQPFTPFKALALLSKYRWNSLENFFATLWGVIAGLTIAADVRDKNIHRVHGAWATLPATSAAVVSRLVGIPFSFGAHAYDVYRFGGDGFLSEKLKAASFVHTTTQTNVDYLSSLAPHAKIILARRGLSTLPNVTTDWFTHENVRIISVGRLVKKKGYHLQLTALAELKNRGVSAQLKIIGDGPLRAELESTIKNLSLKQDVELTGSLEPIEVARAYRESDIFWFTGIVDDEGDRDGLPNVIPEAMAHGLGVISSRSAGAMEAIHDGETGLVADAADTDAWADATMELIQDKAFLRRLTQNARAWVEKNFVAADNTAILAQALRKMP